MNKNAINLLTTVRLVCRSSFRALNSTHRRSIHRGHKKAHILGIETSCDDTAIAIINEHGTVLGEAHNSQLATHIAMGGIIPPLARTLHKQHIEQVHKDALRSSGMHPKQLDAVAVTTRPGLSLSLQVGLDHAKAFCQEYSLPLISVHHMEAHALVVRSCMPVKFPFLVLLVSGGHCQIAVVRDVADFVLLGTTLDDAPGEAFDKTARRLKLNNMDEYRCVSGGTAIERLARQGDPTAIEFVPPMTRNPNCDFSFSGLKGSIARKILAHEHDLGVEGDAILPNVADFCASFQHAIYSHIMKRMQRAFTFCRRTNLDFGDRLVISGFKDVDVLNFEKDLISGKWIQAAHSIMIEQSNYRDVGTFPKRKGVTDNRSIGQTGFPIEIVVNASEASQGIHYPVIADGYLDLPGGVACSLYLRLVMEQLCENQGINLYVPPPKLCSDNGIMIAWNGMEHFRSGRPLVSPDNLDSVDFLAKCPLGQDRREDVSREAISSERFKLDMDRLMRDSFNVKWQNKAGVKLS